MKSREVCADCKKPSPETDTNYTLISSRYGWRLTRSRGPDGKAIVEWRCADCWRKYKAASGDPPSGTMSTPPVAGTSVPPPNLKRPIRG
ncbi:MAG: hypothetical protein ACHREM_25480 [Polyangiales bacterium]